MSGRSRVEPHAEQRRRSPGVRGNGWLDEYVPYSLYRVTNKLNARLLERLKSTKTNPSRWRVLSVLRAYGTLTVGEIVEHTLMEQPTVSRVVQRLEREGRVTRSPARDDTRVRQVTLTRKGVATFEAIVPTAQAHAASAFAGISQSDLHGLVRVLSRIERNIDSAARLADSGRHGRGRVRA